MKAVGITAEYNPLHNGHAYHIMKARELSGCDAVAVAMSGDFVQRGEPALVDKWSRTEAALRNGADLVVEIPVCFCLGNAGQYAQGAVGTLEALGMVTHLSFGSESGELSRLTSAAEILEREAASVRQSVAELLSTGMSYPAARARAFASFSDDSDILSSPNDILAVEYLLAAKRLLPVPVKRVGAGYNETDAILQNSETDYFQSAAGIRKLIGTDGISAVRAYIPADSVGSLESEHMTFPKEWWEVLRYAVMSRDALSIEDCPSGGEGLGNLLKREIMKAGSPAELINAVKSKRYTYTRISRLCMQIILGITRADYRPGYIRILGANETGRRFLREIKKENANTLPLLTNINKDAHSLSDISARRLLDMDIHAADIYNLVTGRDIQNRSDRIMRPVML